MSVMSSVRPGNRNRAMHHAAATPNTRLSATATGATVTVSRIECRVSGSPTRLRQYTPTPPASACANTLTSGITISPPTMSSVASVSPPRTSQWSCRDRRNGAGATSVAGDSACIALTPSLQQVDQGQEDERHDQEDD